MLRLLLYDLTKTPLRFRKNAAENENRLLHLSAGCDMIKFL